MKSVPEALIAVVLAGSLAWVGSVLAQVQPPAQSSSAPATIEKQVEGQIKTVDASRNSLTLADGTELIVPETMMTEVRNDLAPGVTVKAAYLDGDPKIVTHLIWRAKP
jgi:hypothetical protein